MSYEEHTQRMSHKLSLEERQRMQVGGVEEILSFDEQQVVAATVKGELTVRGSGLKVDKLDKDKGELSIAGQIDALFYAAERSGDGFWTRLWRG